METETIENIWHHTRCIELLKGQEIIEIDADCSVTEGCEILVKNGISSAPVFSKKLNCYVGMLDYRDIVDYVLYVFQKKVLDPISEEESVEIAEIVEKAQSGAKVSAQAVSDLSHKNPFYSVMLEAPISAALDVLGTDNGIHRLNVVDGQGKVRGILSQTDIAKFLLSKRHLFPELMKSTLRQLNMGCGPVFSINAEGSVLEALEKMSEFYVSSLAVVESDGTLIGNISMADIRFIFQLNRYHRLWMTCSQFITMVLNQKGLEHGGNDQFPFFDAHLDSSIEQVLSKVLATKVHRVWVTDTKSQHLLGLVSLTDLIQLFFEKSFKSIGEADEERLRSSEGDYEEEA